MTGWSGLTSTASMSVTKGLSITALEDHPNLGQSLAIRLWMSSGDWHAQTLFDNVRLTAVPIRLTGGMLLVR